VSRGRRFHRAGPPGVQVAELADRQPVEGRRGREAALLESAQAVEARVGRRLPALARIEQTREQQPALEIRFAGLVEVDPGSAGRVGSEQRGETS